MNEPNHGKWIQVTPELCSPALAKLEVFSAEALLIRGAGPASAESAEEIDSLRDDYLEDDHDVEDALAYEAALYVFADIVKQGRGIRASNGCFEYEALVTLEDGQEAGQHAVKDLRRGQLLVARDAQLKTPSVRDFISKMERRRLHGRAFKSIFSLMRDGRELQRSLSDVRAQHDDLVERAEALRDVIDPYIQVIEGEEHCEHTGLKLKEIWRYFRHTWATVSKSTPGRSIMVLIRDRAAPDDPVIGIASLSSPAMQIRQRDCWIGWHPDCLLSDELSEPAHSFNINDETFLWMNEIIQGSISETFHDDFIEEQLITPQQLDSPDLNVVKALKEEAISQRNKHQRNAARTDHKSVCFEDTDEYWEAQARTHLYKSKRALALAWLLDTRHEMKTLGEDPSIAEIKAWVETPRGKRAFSKVLRKAKADRVGVSLADISICGAVSPYNSVLGGKLVCMMLMSPEVTEAYRKRYEAASSIIASSVAGRKMRRPAELVLLGTTSLYGASSQYNRVRVPTSEVGLSRAEKVSFIKLGYTEGYGTDQFSVETADVLGQLLTQRDSKKQVNSVFGEGVNPRLRKIRGGLDELGLPSDSLLIHGVRRALYAIPLAANFREYLIGEADTPDYIMAHDDSVEMTRRITQWWRRRWLAKRVRLDRVLEEVGSHTLVHPISHGARVILPPDDDRQQTIFDPYYS